MPSKWDKYTRVGLDAASTVTSIGFSAAKAGTKFGFAITRGVASTVADITGSAVDHAFFGGSVGAGSLLGNAVSTAISAIETLALAPILLGESLTSTSFTAAHSTLSILSTIFPGSDDASFSLASFVTLVRREWADPDPAARAGLPAERPGVAQTVGALSAWATLQGVTAAWDEQRWLAHMSELAVHDAAPAGPRARVDSHVHITSDVVNPRHSQIVTADIGEAGEATEVPRPRRPETARSLSGTAVHPFLSNAELKETLRRFSKMVLAGYGGASLWFFGVSYLLPAPPPASEKRQEERTLAEAVDASEAETRPGGDQAPTPGPPPFSWWDVLRGKHDQEIFLSYANSQPASATEVPPPTAHVGMENYMPRFWVLTDHARREVVLVIRGTMSLNELAVDLTCDTAPFELPSARYRSRSRPPAPGSDTDVEEQMEGMPGTFPVDLSQPELPARRRTVSGDSTLGGEEYLVHGGMLKMARVMGGRGKPVHVAVRDALRRNRGYSLVLCGHSLGAGVAGLLALMWANPKTRLTHAGSGLPRHRLVSAYLFAPPCLTCARLGELAGRSGLLTSFVYSHDVVSRLSLGTVRDMKRAAAWLCVEEREGARGYVQVTKRAVKWKAGFGEEGDEEWFLAMRKTLEANMHMTELYPPGRVLWALRDGELHPTHRRFTEQAADGTKRKSKVDEKVRLFAVHPGHVDKVFGQIVFSRDMLSSHLPHEYDRVLHELL